MKRLGVYEVFGRVDGTLLLGRDCHLPNLFAQHEVLVHEVDFGLVTPEVHVGHCLERGGTSPDALVETLFLLLADLPALVTGHDVLVGLPGVAQVLRRLSLLFPARSHHLRPPHRIVVRHIHIVFDLLEGLAFLFVQLWSDLFDSEGGLELLLEGVFGLWIGRRDLVGGVDCLSGERHITYYIG